jgi:hypothetical protein
MLSKQGTNTFSGVAFIYAASNRLTAKDFLAKQEDLPKPEVTKRDWGFVFGGPLVRNKAHFFFSLERQVDKPNRTRIYSTRPSLNFSIAEDRTDWNTIVRFDHQINPNHTWGIRWLREDAPQHPTIAARATRETFGDETDRDQVAVGTLTSVFGTSCVNTVLAKAKTGHDRTSENRFWCQCRVVKLAATIIHCLAMKASTVSLKACGFSYSSP